MLRSRRHRFQGRLSPRYLVVNEVRPRVVPGFGRGLRGPADAVEGGDPFAGAGLAGPASVTVSDRLFAASHFYGGQFGSQLECQSGRLVARVTGQVALGTVREIVD